MPRVRTHPGEVLKEDYLVPLGMSARALAAELGVSANRVSEIVRGNATSRPTPHYGLPAISAPTHAFGSTCKPRTIFQRRKPRMIIRRLRGA